MVDNLIFWFGHLSSLDVLLKYAAAALLISLLWIVFNTSKNCDHDGTQGTFGPRQQDLLIVDMLQYSLRQNNIRGV